MRLDRSMFGKRTLTAAVAGLACALAGLGAAQAQTRPLTVKVMTASETGLHANIAIIEGEKDAVLVDAPFTRADAYRVAAQILDDNKVLKAVIVTHAHPDHYFGLGVIHDVFPDARIIAQPAVAHDVLDAFPRRFAFWGPQIGQNAPRYQMTPTPYGEKTFELEGQEIALLGPMRGDAPNTTMVWVPSAKAVMTGDILFDQNHIYLAGTDKTSRAAWNASLDAILALKPQMIVPGHMPPGAPLTRASVDFTRAYIAKYEEVAAKAGTVDEFKALMRKAYPNVPEDEFVLTATAESAMKEKAAK
jgi:glyoxylase-like metal-dependent hydrolase (beta-lactamase superfamily II)